MSDVETREVFVTNDLTLAAYLRMRRVEMFGFKRLGKMYKFSFDGTANIEQMKIDFVHSESSRFDDEVRKLKKIMFSES